jgi:hypothetical protein
MNNLAIPLESACAVMLTAALAACSPSSQTLVIDGWWDVDYAKNGCLLAQPRMPLCESEREQSVRAFESELLTQFAATADCAGLRVVQTAPKTGDPPLPKEHWIILLNYGGEETAQQWMLTATNNNNMNQGRGTPKEIAETVCHILKKRGAKVEER